MADPIRGNASERVYRLGADRTRDRTCVRLKPDLLCADLRVDRGRVVQNARQGAGVELDAGKRSGPDGWACGTRTEAGQNVPQAKPEQATPSDCLPAPRA